ncbi:MAG TPA: L,D-transpeptidase, partial [Acidimicrobiales bacterium]|nr:L,D-transpeptidase [Acidimicrobiales bacterium]
MDPHTRAPRQVRLRRTIVVTTAVLLATAFGFYYSMQGPAPRRHPAAEGHPASSPTTSLPPQRPPRVGIPVPPWTTLATLHGPVPGYPMPAAVGPARIVAPTWGAAVTLPVTARRTHWLEVRVIGRPNGQTAWVRAADVSLTRTPYYIVVDLSRRHLLLFREGKLRLYAPAGVGAPQTPT